MINIVNIVNLNILVSVINVRRIKMGDIFDELLKFKFYKLTYGFECEDGWFNIIRDMSNELDKVVKEYNIKTFEIVQLKEKFGELRVYWNCLEDNNEFGNKINTIISKYEELSKVTCIMCGKPGKIAKDRYWIIPLCEKCNYD